MEWDKEEIIKHLIVSYVFKESMKKLNRKFQTSKRNVKWKTFVVKYFSNYKLLPTLNLEIEHHRIQRGQVIAQDIYCGFIQRGWNVLTVMN